MRKGTQHSTKTKSLLSKHSCGRKFSSTTRSKMAAAHTGLRHSLFSRSLIAKHNLHKKLSPTTKAKISATMKKRHARLASPEFEVIQKQDINQALLKMDKAIERIF